MSSNNGHYVKKIKFTKKMKKDYTLLIPEMAPLHFRLIEPILSRQGFHIDLMNAEGPEVLQKGLQTVHNDTCYPAMLITGQMLTAMESGKYDPHKVAMVITQSGGGCRDSNYINIMRKAFDKAGYSYVPFVSANTWNLEFNPGINLSIRTLLLALAGLMYGDYIMILANQVRPYEVNKGETDKTVDKWIEIISEKFKKGKGFMPGNIDKTMKLIGADFAAIPIKKTPKVKVAIVGELFLKYSVPGNNHLEEFLVEQDCEFYMPSMLSFGVYKTNGALEDLRAYGGKPLKRLIMEIVMAVYFKVEDMLTAASGRLVPIATIVRPVTSCEIPDFDAMADALPVNQSAPFINRANPITSNRPCNIIQTPFPITHLYYTPFFTLISSGKSCNCIFIREQYFYLIFLHLP